MELTIHAKDRLIKRCGYKRSTIEKNAENALQYGLKHSDLDGSIKRYVDKLYFSGKKCNEIRIYNQYVYLFKNSSLITVLLLPNKYKKTYVNIKNKLNTCK